jgi:hypothetical protein
MSKFTNPLPGRLVKFMFQIRLKKLRFSRAILCIALFVAAMQQPVLSLAQEYQDDPIQERFDDALSALEANQVLVARQLLAELLADHPTLHRARLELARAEYLSRDYAAAEAQVLEVLEDPDVPVSVRTTLLAFLAQIRDDRLTFEEPHSWGGYVYTGLMYDSNVNFGTTRDVVNVGGVPLKVEDISKELDDWAAVLDAGFSHSYNPNKKFRSGDRTGYFLWHTQGNGYYRRYQDEDDYNLGVLTLRTGPVWAVPEKWRASLGVQADQIFLDDSKLAVFLTVNPNINILLNQRTELTLDLALTDRNYDDGINEARDGTYKSGLAVLTRFYLARDLGLQLGAGYSDFDADVDVLSYDSPEVFVGATYQAWQGGTVFGRLGYRNYDYDDPVTFLPGLSASRDDDEIRFVTGVQHLINGDVLNGWVVKAEYAYTDNDSNLDLFDYDRHQVSLGISKGF